MRKLMICAIAALIAVGASAQTSKSLYNKYSEEKGMSAVYISPAMFKMIGKLPEAGGTDLSGVIESLEAMYILSSESGSANANLRNEVQKLVSSKKMELMMEAKDDGELVRMYTTTAGKFVTDLIMLVGEKDEFTFIGIEGKIDPDKLAKLIASED